MVPLAVDNIPLTVDDSAIDARREVIVPIGRPCTHSANLLALEFLDGGELTTHIRRQDSNLDACSCQPSSYLKDVRLKASYIGDIACCHEQHTQRARFR